MTWMKHTALLVLILLAGASQLSLSAQKKSLDQFAKCLSEKQAVFYGSYRCPHCTEQKQLFGESFQHVKYIECAIRGSRDIAFECKVKQIRGVPTWIFADGERKSGKLSLEQLSEKTGCRLP
jgi:hypothetical protein